MGRNLNLCLEREWYSLRDIQEVFRISRESIASILQDAEKQGSPVKVVALYFRNHPSIPRQRPFVRVEKRSLVDYLCEYCGTPREQEKNSPWMEWLSASDVEKIYGFSRESLRRILRDAEWKGMSIRTIRLPFANGVKKSRRAFRYQVERRSLNAYLEAHLTSLTGGRRG